MLGPIFYLEMLLGGRRGRQYYLRWFIAGILTLQLLGFYLKYDQVISEGRDTTGMIPPNAASNFGGDFTRWLLMQQFLIILLATPVFTAGAVSDEKTRGTLLYLFAADLNAWEILIGKLLGRSFEVLLLLLTTLPLLCFIGVFGGVTPLALLAIALMFLGPVFAIGSASLLMSVWVRQTRDAVVGLYALGGLLYLLWLGLVELGGLGARLAARCRQAAGDVLRPVLCGRPRSDCGGAEGHPRAPDWLVGRLGHFWRDLFRHRRLAAAGSLPETTRTFGPVHARRPLSAAASRGQRRTAAVEGTARGWHRAAGDFEGLAALVRAAGNCRADRAARRVVAGIHVRTNDPRRIEMDFHLRHHHLARRLQDQRRRPGFSAARRHVVLVVGSLVVGIRCSGTISGEREKQTWEALLLTPLETQSLIRNKLWGILGAAVPYVMAYTIPALFLATLVGPDQGWILMVIVAILAILVLTVFRKQVDSIRSFWVALIAAVILMVISIPIGGGVLFLTFLCLIVTALAMFYMGAAGIFCSVRAARRGAACWRRWAWATSAA